jgi:hypothetical protein
MEEKFWHKVYFGLNNEVHGFQQQIVALGRLLEARICVMGEQISERTSNFTEERSIIHESLDIYLEMSNLLTVRLKKILLNSIDDLDPKKIEERRLEEEKENDRIDEKFKPSKE